MQPGRRAPPAGTCALAYWGTYVSHGQPIREIHICSRDVRGQVQRERARAVLRLVAVNAHEALRLLVEPVLQRDDNALQPRGVFGYALVQWGAHKETHIDMRARLQPIAPLRAALDVARHLGHATPPAPRPATVSQRAQCRGDQLNRIY